MINRISFTLSCLMLRSLSVGRSSLALAILSFLAFTLAIHAPACASPITFNFSGFPADQLDLVNGGYDVVAATLTTNTSGTELASASFSITTGLGTTYTVTNATIEQDGLQVIGSNLELASGAGPERTLNALPHDGKEEFLPS